jgi:hypothetical protein
VVAQEISLLFSHAYQETLYTRFTFMANLIDAGTACEITVSGITSAQQTDFVSAVGES